MNLTSALSPRLSRTSEKLEASTAPTRESEVPMRPLALMIGGR